MSLQLAAPRAPCSTAGLWPVSLRRLALFSSLAPLDETLIKRLKPRTLPGGAKLARSEPEEKGAWIVLSGWCARIRAMPDGRRQIVNLILPGDSIGIDAVRWAGNDLPVAALSPVIVADAEPLRRVVELRPPEHTRLIEACERAALCEQVYCINSLVRMGQQTAYERLAHLLLELNTRLEGVGLVSSRGYQLPVTQDVIAHALGLSLVHLSRTLRQMRKEGSIMLQPGHVQILKPDVLAQAANFPHAVTWSEQRA